MHLTAVRAFEAAARHKNLQRAAEELCVTRGAISHQVLQLEESLGVLLFSRARKQLALTAEGQRLAELLGVALDQINAALKATRAASSPNVLRLRMSPTLAIRWLVPRLADFSGTHPQIDVELSTASQDNAGLLDGVDFAIRLDQGDHRPDEDALLLFKDGLLPVCAPSIAAQLHAPAGLASVVRLHSMMRLESWKIWFDDLGLPIDPYAGPRFANAALAYQAAINGIGVAIAQSQFVEQDLKDGRLVAPFAHTATSATGYYLVNDASKRDWPKIKLFREWIEVAGFDRTEA